MNQKDNKISTFLQFLSVLQKYLRSEQFSELLGVFVVIVVALELLVLIVVFLFESVLGGTF